LCCAANSVAALDAAAITAFGVVLSCDIYVLEHFAELRFIDTGPISVRSFIGAPSLIVLGARNESPKKRAVNALLDQQARSGYAALPRCSKDSSDRTVRGGLEV
jgi:hypothetical protein